MPRRLFFILIASSFVLSSCSPQAVGPLLLPTPGQALVVEAFPTATLEPGAPTPFPTRPAYDPGQLVDYTAQTGDTLPAIAKHFNTSVDEILKANTFIPASATTMPPAMPMKIPIYYAPFWGNPYQILPDSLFIDGPAQIGFDIKKFVDGTQGWLKNYSGYGVNDELTGAETINLIAKNYSVSPRLLLAVLEYQSGALTQPAPPDADYPLGFAMTSERGLYNQLDWAANILNNGYYGWRAGSLATFDLLNGRIERPDPWQNAATVGLQYYFSRLLPPDRYARAISATGLAAVYAKLFGDPWQNVQPHIPGSLVQPRFQLPIQPGKVWAYTGGPHTGWGYGEPWAAIDFAPPSMKGGCEESQEWVTAVAAGVIARSEPAIVVLDLDGDGDERTGWDVFYLHISGDGRVAQGTKVKAGDLIGHPSCDGGRATGTHVHFGRKFNGEWLQADSPVAFIMENWIVKQGSAEYIGTLNRNHQVITACTCSDYGSQIMSGVKP